MASNAATSYKPAPPPKVAKPRRPSQPRRTRRTSWAAGGSAGRLGHLKEFARDRADYHATEYEGVGFSNSIASPTADGQVNKFVTFNQSRANRPGSKGIDAYKVAESGIVDGSERKHDVSAANQFFASDSSVGISPIGGTRPRDARSRAEHAMKVFGDAVARLHREKGRRHSFGAGKATASYLSRKPGLDENSQVSALGYIRHAESEQVRRFGPSHAWGGHGVPERRAAGEGAQSHASSKSSSSKVLPTMSFNGGRGSSNGGSREIASESKHDVNRSSPSPAALPTRLEESALGMQADQYMGHLAANAQRRRISELSQDSAVEELRAAEAAILSSRSIPHGPAAAPGSKVPFGYKSQNGASAAESKGIGLLGTGRDGFGTGSGAGGPAVGTDAGGEGAGGGAGGGKAGAAEGMGKNRPHIFEVVQMAVEADRRKCTLAAAVCPCYLWATPQVRKTLIAIQEHWLYVTLNVSLTVFCIVAQDLLLAFFPKTVDPAFEIVYITACTLFLMDTIIASSLDRRIVGTFYWFLDVAAALSLLLDVEAVFNALLDLFGQSDDASDSLSIVKTTVRAGTRVGRILRLLRVLRLIRVYSCVRSCRKLDLPGQCSRGFWSCWHNAGECCIATFVAYVVTHGDGASSGDGGEDGDGGADPSAPETRRASFQAVARRRRKRRSSAVLVKEGLIPARKPTCWALCARGCRGCCSSCIYCFFCVEVKKDGQIRRRRRSSLFAGKGGEKRRRRRSSLHADISRGLSLKSDSQRSGGMSTVQAEEEHIGADGGAGTTRRPFFQSGIQGDSMLEHSFREDRENDGGQVPYGSYEQNFDGTEDYQQGANGQMFSVAPSTSEAEQPRLGVFGQVPSASATSMEGEEDDVAALPLSAVKGKAVSSVPFSAGQSSGVEAHSAAGNSNTDGSSSVIDMDKLRGGRSRTRSDTADGSVTDVGSRDASLVEEPSSGGEASRVGQSDQRENTAGSAAIVSPRSPGSRSSSKLSGSLVEGVIRQAGAGRQHSTGHVSGPDSGSDAERRYSQGTSIRSRRRYAGRAPAVMRNPSMRSVAFSSAGQSVALDTGEGELGSPLLSPHYLSSGMPGSTGRHDSDSLGPRTRIRTLGDDGSDVASQSGGPSVPSSPSRPKPVRSSGGSTQLALAGRSARPRKRHSVAGHGAEQAAAARDASNLGRPAGQAGVGGAARNARASDSDMVVVSKAALEEAFARQQQQIRAQVAMEFASKRGFAGFPAGMASTRVRGTRRPSTHSQLKNPMAKSTRFSGREHPTQQPSLKRDKWKLAKSVLVSNAAKSTKTTGIAAAFKAAISAAKSGGSRPASKRHSDNAGTIPAMLAVARGARSKRTPSGSRVMPAGMGIASIGQRRNSSPSARDAYLAVQAMKSRRARQSGQSRGPEQVGFSSKLTITNPADSPASRRAGKRRSADSVPSPVGYSQRPVDLTQSRSGSRRSPSDDVVHTMFNTAADAGKSNRPSSGDLRSSAGRSSRGNGRANPPIWIRTGSSSTGKQRSMGAQPSSDGEHARTSSAAMSSIAEERVPTASLASQEKAKASQGLSEPDASSKDTRRLRDRPRASNDGSAKPSASSYGAVVAAGLPSNTSIGQHMNRPITDADMAARLAIGDRAPSNVSSLLMQDLGASQALAGSFQDVDYQFGTPDMKPRKASVQSMPTMREHGSGNDSASKHGSSSVSSRSSMQQKPLQGKVQLTRSLRQSDHAVRSVLMKQTIPMSRIATMSQGEVASLPGVMSPKFARSATSGFATKVLNVSRRSAAEELQQALMDGFSSDENGSKSTSTTAKSSQKKFTYGRTSRGNDGGTSMSKGGGGPPRSGSALASIPRASSEDASRVEEHEIGRVSSILSPVKELHSPVEGESGRQIGATTNGGGDFSGPQSPSRFPTRQSTDDTQMTEPSRRPFHLYSAGLGGSGRLGALLENGNSESEDSTGKTDTQTSHDASGLSSRRRSSRAEPTAAGEARGAWAGGSEDYEEEEERKVTDDSGADEDYTEYHSGIPVMDLSANAHQSPGGSPGYMDYTSFARVGVSEATHDSEDPYASFRTGYTSNRSLEQSGRELGDANSSDSDDSEEEEEAMKAREYMGSSRVGQQINQRIRRKIIVFVLAIILLIPLLTYETGNDTRRMLTSLRLIESAGVAPESVPPADRAESFYGAESAQALLVQEFLEEHPNTIQLRIAGATFGDADPDDPSVLVLESDKISELRSSEIEFLVSSRGSQIRLDISDQTRIESIYAFALTQVIIILLGVQAGLLQQDVDTLLVHPLERISMYLRPIMQDAISNISAKKSGQDRSNMLTGQSTSKAKGWRKMLGQDDGEEMSTKLLLAAIECMRRDLSATARRNFARKELMSHLKQADKTKRGIRKSMVMLKKAGQMDEEGGLRFVPVADEDDFLRAYRPGQTNQGRLLRPATSIIPYSKLTRVQEADEAAADEEDDNEEEGGQSSERNLNDGLKTGDGHNSGSGSHGTGSASEELDLGIGNPVDAWSPAANGGIKSISRSGSAAGQAPASAAAPRNPFAIDLDAPGGQAPLLEEADVEQGGGSTRMMQKYDKRSTSAGEDGSSSGGKDEFGLLPLEAMKPPAALTRGASMRKKKKAGNSRANEPELTLGIMSPSYPDPAGTSSSHHRRGQSGFAAGGSTGSQEDGDIDDPLARTMGAGGGLDYTKFAEDPLLAPIADGPTPSGSQSREGSMFGGSGRKLGTLSRSRSRGRRQRNSRRRMTRGSTRELDDEERIKVDGDPDA